MPFRISLSRGVSPRCRFVRGVFVRGEVESHSPVDICRWHRKVFCVGLDEKLGFDTMADIMASGYSRVLVYAGEDTRNIRGYLQASSPLQLDGLGRGYSGRASRRRSSVRGVLDVAGLVCPFSRAWRASFSTFFVGADYVGRMRVSAWSRRSITWRAVQRRCRRG